MSDVIQSTEKICGVFEKAGYFVQIFFTNGINLSGNELGNDPLQETIGLYGGLVSRLLATFDIYSVFMSVLIK